MKEDSDQEADLVRISGKRRSEFPEPAKDFGSFKICAKESTPRRSCSRARQPKGRNYQKAQRANNIGIADPVCKTSIPGSNPGGASKLFRESVERRTGSLTGSGGLTIALTIHGGNANHTTIECGAPRT
jgi:hypothetical protein